MTKVTDAADAFMQECKNAVVFMSDDKKEVMVDCSDNEQVRFAFFLTALSDDVEMLMQSAPRSACRWSDGTFVNPSTSGERFTNVDDPSHIVMIYDTPNQMMFFFVKDGRMMTLKNQDMTNRSEVYRTAIGAV